jgi:hypothetical protein
MPNSTDRVRFAFARLAIEYYGIGRFAALTHSTVVAGNLLHHAVEMILKAALAPHLSLRQLRDLGHSLSALWARFESARRDLAGPEHCRTIVRLDAFERLRYPDIALRDGYEIQIVVSGEPAVSTDGTASASSYNLVLSDVDALFRALLEAASINAQALVPSSPERIDWIKRSNLEAERLFP